MRVPCAGWRQRSVVTEPARQPTKITRSAASTTARVGSVPPFEPTTPTESGCESGIEPWPLIVVQTGASSRSACAASSASAPDRITPPPTTITGRSAEASAAAAASTAFGSGATRAAGAAP